MCRKVIIIAFYILVLLELEHLGVSVIVLQGRVPTVSYIIFVLFAGSSFLVINALLWDLPQ